MQAIQSYGGRLLGQKYKARLLLAFRETLWWVRWPQRMWRKGGIERRMPGLPQHRGWHSAISDKLHITLCNGAIRYTYRGIPMIKNPIDMALYLKLLWELKPATVVEIGSKLGGTAVWIGDMLQTWHLPGRVISIDIKPALDKPWHCPSNVEFMKGDEADLEDMLFAFERLPHPWIIINDASHSRRKIIACMEFFDRYAQSGDYMIIEDGFLTEVGIDNLGERDGGPGQAIAEFLVGRHKRWTIDDRYCDFFGTNVTANTNGYLKRV
jgi:cephalosporin hydroxylase